MTTHTTSLVSDARDIWWILDFANAFVSPGVNSRGELVPSHGASRRRLGDKMFQTSQFDAKLRLEIYFIYFILFYKFAIINDIN
jgi:hypothetical protein